MIYADAHCDTISKALENNECMKSNSGHLDFLRLKGLKGSCLQFFAIFVDPQVYPVRGIDAYVKYIDFMDEQIKINADLVEKIINRSKLISAINKKMLGAIYSIEGGDCIESVEQIDYLYSKGIRAMGLVWNHKNALGSGVEDEGGLSLLGKSVVKRMEQLGVIIDVSHASQKTFYDILDNCNGPVIASHSNAFSICKHPRNLTDSQIKLIAERRGFIGLNFYPPFLKKNALSEIDDIISHYKYISELAGDTIVGLGCDFDGVEFLPKGITDITSIKNVLKKMKSMSFSTESIKGFQGQNLYNFIVGLQNF